MGIISRMVEYAAVQRERDDLGGTIQFTKSGNSPLVFGDPIPCSMGADLMALMRDQKTAGFDLNETRKLTVRTALLQGLARQPQSGDTVKITGNLPNSPSVQLQISDEGGIQSLHGILTVLSLYNPDV